MIKAHEEAGAALTIASHTKKLTTEFGVLEADENGILTDYIEKPDRRIEVSMGVYVYDPRVLRFIEKGTYLDLPNLVHKLMEAGETVAIHRNEAFWLDIGRPEDFALAQQIYEADASRFGDAA